MGFFLNFNIDQVNSALALLSQPDIATVYSLHWENSSSPNPVVLGDFPLVPTILQSEPIWPEHIYKFFSYVTENSLQYSALGWTIHDAPARPGRIPSPTLIVANKAVADLGGRLPSGRAGKERNTDCIGFGPAQSEQDSLQPHWQRYGPRGAGLPEGFGLGVPDWALLTARPGLRVPVIS